MATKKLCLHQPGDSHEMRQAVAWCVANGLPVTRTSPHQLKIQPFNLWPNKQSWNRDDDPKKKTGGFPAFQKAVAEWWIEKQEPYAETLYDLP